MSLGSDYMADYAYEIEHEKQELADMHEKLQIQAKCNAFHGLWQTKDGDWLHVTEMGSQHIKNCIRMLERNNSPFADIYIPMFKEELERREENEHERH